MDMPIMPTGEELLEKGKSGASSAMQTAVSDVSNSVQNQVGIKSSPNQPQTQNQPQPDIQRSEASVSPQNSQDTLRTQEMVEDFYSPSDSTPRVSPENFEETERQTKLAHVRQELLLQQHNDVYYNDIANAGVSRQQEERPAEKVERQQMEELQVKEQKTQNGVSDDVLKHQIRVEAVQGTVG